MAIYREVCQCCQQLLTFRIWDVRILHSHKQCLYFIKWGNLSVELFAEQGGDVYRAILDLTQQGKECIHICLPTRKWEVLAILILIKLTIYYLGEDSIPYTISRISGPLNLSRIFIPYITFFGNAYIGTGFPNTSCTCFCTKEKSVVFLSINKLNFNILVLEIRNSHKIWGTRRDDFIKKIDY